MLIIGSFIFFDEISFQNFCPFSIGIASFHIACILSRFSRVRLCVTQWTVACQAPLSAGFSWQEYWRDCHVLLQGIFPTRGLKPVSWVSCRGRLSLYLWATDEGLCSNSWTAKLFVYSVCNSYIRGVVCNIFFSICSLSFYFLNDVFWGT